MVPSVVIFVATAFPCLQNTSEMLQHFLSSMRRTAVLFEWKRFAFVWIELRPTRYSVFRPLWWNSVTDKCSHCNHPQKLSHWTQSRPLGFWTPNCFLGLKLELLIVWETVDLNHLRYLGSFDTNACRFLERPHYLQPDVSEFNAKMTWLQLPGLHRANHCMTEKRDGTGKTGCPEQKRSHAVCELFPFLEVCFKHLE